MAVMTVTKENFQEEVMQAGCPVLLDFWATWCGPCRMVSPIVDEIGAEVTDAKVGKVNVDEQPDKKRLHFLRSRFSLSFCDFIMLFSCPFC